jgi:hypothetical protein
MPKIGVIDVEGRGEVEAVWQCDLSFPRGHPPYPAPSLRIVGPTCTYSFVEIGLGLGKFVVVVRVPNPQSQSTVGRGTPGTPKKTYMCANMCVLSVICVCVTVAHIRGTTKTTPTTDNWSIATQIRTLASGGRWRMANGELASGFCH